MRSVFFLYEIYDKKPQIIAIYVKNFAQKVALSITVKLSISDGGKVGGSRVTRFTDRMYISKFSPQFAQKHRGAKAEKSLRTGD